MIDENYARLLTGKVVTALLDRLKKAQDDDSAQADLARIRRLADDGQIHELKLQIALENIEGNESLSDDLRSEASSELPRYRSDRDNSKLANPDITQTPDFSFSNTMLPAPWPASELAERGWVAITGGELAGFLSQITPVDGVIRVVPETTQCHWHTLPWYDKVALIRIYDPTWQDPNLTLYYLTFESNLYRLNGTSPPIHEINSKAPIQLNRDNVLDYVRFFCFFVRGDEGPFYIAEREDDPFLPVLEDSPSLYEYREHLSPASLTGMDAAGKFLCTAAIYYSNAMFRSEMAVHPSGMIDMLSDQPLTGNLPGRIVAPIGWSDR